jgi:NADH-quinone oxidoreductase subunit M
MISVGGLPLVTIVTFLPLLGALAVAFTPAGRPNVARYTALGFALAAWVASLVMLAAFVASNGCPWCSSS